VHQVTGPGIAHDRVELLRFLVEHVPASRTNQQDVRRGLASAHQCRVCTQDEVHTLVRVEAADVDEPLRLVRQAQAARGRANPPCFLVIRLGGRLGAHPDAVARHGRPARWTWPST
jgi:hypothetical protein